MFQKKVCLSARFVRDTDATPAKTITVEEKPMITMAATTKNGSSSEKFTEITMETLRTVLQEEISKRMHENEAKLVTDNPIIEIVDPCVPSPCGPNSICRVIKNQASCSCLRSYHGIPPNC